MDDTPYHTTPPFSHVLNSGLMRFSICNIGVDRTGFDARSLFPSAAVAIIVYIAVGNGWLLGPPARWLPVPEYARCNL